MLLAGSSSEVPLLLIEACEESQGILQRNHGLLIERDASSPSLCSNSYIHPSFFSVEIQD